CAHESIHFDVGKISEIVDQGLRFNGEFGRQRLVPFLGIDYELFEETFDASVEGAEQTEWIKALGKDRGQFSTSEFAICEFRNFETYLVAVQIPIDAEARRLAVLR